MTVFPDFPRSPEASVLSVHNPSGFDIPVSQPVLEDILKAVETGEKITFRFLELVYVDENGIVEINREYLGRDYVTDIISFHYDDKDETDPAGREGTLYCCAPRIAEQSREAETKTTQEFYRIFIHGLLHLAGYEDTSEAEKLAMTKLENHYLKQAGI